MTRLIRIAAGAAVALWSVAATAGDGAGEAPAKPAPSQPTAPPPAAQPSASNQGTPALVLDTSEYEGLLGKSVRALNGDDLGRIIDVIVDKEGRPRAAIIDFGGFLGVGSRKIAVDWRVLKFAAPDGKTGPVTLQLSRNQVRVSPEYKSGEPIVVLGAASPGAPAGEGDPAAAAQPVNAAPAVPTPTVSAPAPVAAPAAQDKPAEPAREKAVERPTDNKPADRPPEKAPE